MLSGQLPQADDNQSSGISGILQDPRLIDVLYGLGKGLSAHGADRRVPIVPTAVQGIQEAASNRRKQDFYNAAQDPAILNDPAALKKFAVAAIQSGIPQVQQLGFKALFPKLSETSGTVPQAIKIAQALGYKQGTPEFNDYIRTYTLGRGLTAGQKELDQFGRQLRKEFPNKTDDQISEIQSAYLNGRNTLPDGSAVPEISGTARTILKQTVGRGVPAQIRNQAASSAQIVKELEDLDITPLKKFTGIAGKADVLKYRANMALGKDVPQEFRDYLSFQSSLSNLNMDTIRQALKTSVVPGYVNRTLKGASNPGSNWWYDPKQVQNDYNKTLQWFRSHRDALTKQVRQGELADLGEGTTKPTVSWRVENGKLVRG